MLDNLIEELKKGIDAYDVHHIELTRDRDRNLIYGAYCTEDESAPVQFTKDYSIDLLTHDEVIDLAIELDIYYCLI